MMRAFPACFPPPVFDALDLNRYAEAYQLAAEFLEAEAEAVREASQRTR